MILTEGNAQVFVDHMFRIFDKDNNGSIEFTVRAGKYLRRVLLLEQEFMIATDMTTGGTLEERLRWAFKMYDEDGSGDHIERLDIKIQAEQYFQEKLMRRKWKK